MKKDKEKNHEEKKPTDELDNINDNVETNENSELKDDKQDSEEIKDNNHEPSEEEKLQVEIKNLKEERIRVLAEMENLRKRFDREKIDSIKYGSANFARDILLPSDNLERALSALNKEEEHPQSIKNLIEGLLMVKKELSKALEKNGITKINSIDEKFDPNLHQAMMEVENDDLDEGIVVQEIQPGYMMYDRLLRPAMVGVSKKSQKEIKSDNKSELTSDSE